MTADIAFLVVPVLKALVVLVIGLGVAWAYGLATRNDVALRATEEPDGTHPDLVVIFHGLSRRAATRRAVREAAEEAFDGKADIFMPRYRTGVFSGASPFDICAELGDAIHDLEQRHHMTYERIHLIGCSMGGLFARKAFVWGCGETSDQPGYGRDVVRPDDPATLSFVRPWVMKVERIVLLAGVTRGWSVADRPPSQLRIVHWTNKLLRRVFPPLPGLMSLFRSFERGEPFVANLRVQWIHVARNWSRLKDAIMDHGSDTRTRDIVLKTASERPFPIVVQILGTADKLVHLDDHRDVAAGAGFIHLPIQGGNHSAAFDFSKPKTGAKARALFMAALSESKEELVIRARGVPTFDVDPDVEHVIFAVHGIRDYGDWPVRFAEIVRERAADKAPLIAVETPSYGFFPMLAFLLFRRRQARVRWLLDRYTEILAKYPNVRDVSFVGHSNGTYLLASALETYSEFHVHRVAFAGSVVRRDFDWESPFREGRVHAIMNVVASNDLVVACLPRVFEYPLLRRINDVGSAGFTGFESSVTHADEVRFVKGNHGIAVREHLEPIADYVLTGTRPAPDRWVIRSNDAADVPPEPLPANLVSSADRWAHRGSRFAWLLWSVGVVALIAPAVVVLIGPSLGLEVAFLRDATLAMRASITVAVYAVLGAVLSTV